MRRQTEFKFKGKYRLVEWWGEFIEVIYFVVGMPLGKLSKAADEHKLFRKVGFFFTLWLTWVSLDWCFEFVMAAKDAGIDHAAIVAAIMAPVATLQGYVLQNYYRAEGNDKK